MKPVVNPGECIGCGQCEQICPEIFELGEDGIARVINEDPSASLKGQIDEAIEECPVGAISWEE